MHNLNRKIRLFGYAFVLTMAAGTAQAATDFAFDFSAPTTGSGSGSSMRYHYDTNSAGIGVDLSGWQANSNSSTFRNRTNNLKTRQGGLRLDRRESGDNNLIDNDGKMELIILEFDEMVSLDEISMGDIGGDFDFTLLAHTGSGTPPLSNYQFGYNPSGASARMLNQGWELVGSYDTAPSQRTTDVNQVRVYSSFWAIGAYTSALTDSSRTYGNPNQGDDYFALLSLAGERLASVAVSEPSTIGLLLLALGLLGVAGRRKTASRAA